MTFKDKEAVKLIWLETTYEGILIRELLNKVRFINNKDGLTEIVVIESKINEAKI